MDYTNEQRKKAMDFAKMMETSYGIKRITTKAQANNGTSMFLMPTGETVGVYQSGMIRKYFRDRFGNMTCYQLNKTFQGKRKDTYLSDDKLKTFTYDCTNRILVHGALARLKYMLEYAIKNYGVTKIDNKEINVVYDVVKSVQDDMDSVITVNGVKYMKLTEVLKEKYSLNES